MLADRAGIMISPKAAEAAGDEFRRASGVRRPLSVREPGGPGQHRAEAVPRPIGTRRSYHFDRVVYRPMPNSAVRLANLQAGSVDLVEQILPSDVAAVRRDPQPEARDRRRARLYRHQLQPGQRPGGRHTASARARLVRARLRAGAGPRRHQPGRLRRAVHARPLQANPPSSPFYVAGPCSRRRATSPRPSALLKQAGVPLPVPVTLTADQRARPAAGGRDHPVDGRRGRVRRQAEGRWSSPPRCRPATPAISRPT